MGPYELLERIVSALERLKIPYLVTGSVAAMAYGEPRLTNDIDVVAHVREGHIPDLVMTFPPDEFYLSEEGIRDAIRHQGQFNIIHPESGLKVDVIIPKGTPFDDSRFQRARRIRPSETYEARFAAPEDVIIKKLEFYRDGGSEKHLRDIAGILRISHDEIDHAYLSEWVDRLGLRPIWNAILQRLREKER